MTAFKTLGTTGNAAGVVTPLDHKLAQAALFCKTTTPLLIRAGLLYEGNSSIVTGTSGMSYDVAPYNCATQRSAGAGVGIGGNDGVVNVATTAAPGSNARYDVVYHWPREYSLDGSSSTPVIGVVQGVPGSSPSVPSLAAFPGAIELARILVPSGVTATNTGTTFTQTAPFTSGDGGKVPFRTKAAMDLWTTALLDQWAIDLATRKEYRRDVSSWVPLVDTGIVIPTVSVTGGGYSVNPTTGEITLTGAVTIVDIGGMDSSAEDYTLEGFLDLSTSVALLCRVLFGGTPDTGANYNYTSIPSSPSGAVAYWAINGAGGTHHQFEARFMRTQSLVETQYRAEANGRSGMNADVAGINRGHHTGVVAPVTGVRIYLSGAGNFNGKVSLRKVLR